MSKSRPNGLDYLGGLWEEKQWVSENKKVSVFVIFDVIL